MDHAYWGAPLDEGAISAAVGSSDLPSLTAPSEDALIARVVELLAAGKGIGWAQGRVEFGPRALRNRSILARPPRSGMKDPLNNQIQFRQPYRPFPPSLPGEPACPLFRPR